MIVDGTLAGVPHQKMLIDTGAVPSVINARVAKRIGLSGSASELSLMNRSIAVERVHVPEVGLGPLSATVLDMVSVDLEKLEQALATRIDAVIGLDFLAQRNFSLDYQHKRLIIGEDSISSGRLHLRLSMKPAEPTSSFPWSVVAKGCESCSTLEHETSCYSKAG